MDRQWHLVCEHRCPRAGAGHGGCWRVPAGGVEAARMCWVGLYSRQTGRVQRVLFLPQLTGPQEPAGSLSEGQELGEGRLSLSFSLSDRLWKVQPCPGLFLS